MKKQVKNFILIASISTQLLVVPTLTALSCSKATKNEIQQFLNDVSKTVKVVCKNGINKSEVLSKNINKDNFYEYFDLDCNLLNNEIKISIIDCKEDPSDSTSLLISLKINYKNESLTKPLKIVGFKDPNIVSLIKQNFDISEFETNNNLFAEDFKSNITKEWIHQNKKLIFNGEFNVDDINLLDVQVLDSVYIVVNVNIKNIPCSFQIEGFKIKNDNDISKLEITLINDIFESSQFGFESNTFEEIKEAITNQWIFNNRKILFENSDLIQNQDNIKLINIISESNGTIASIHLEVNNKSFNFKIRDLLLIDINKTIFQASELGLESTTFEELKNIVNDQWIFAKKAIIFNSNVLNYINLEQISNTNYKEISNKTKIEISFTFKNKFFSFMVENLKEDSKLPFVEPTNLEELRKADPNDIAKMKVYDSSKFSLVVTPEQQGYPICWAYGVSAASEASIIKEGFYNNQNLNIDELEIDRITNIRTSLDDPIGYSSYDTFNYPLKEGGFMDQAAFSLTQKKLSSLGLYLENYELIDTNNIDEIKKMIAKYGAITANYNASNQGFRKPYWYSVGRANHGVSIIGWDDTIKKENFTNLYSTPPIDGAWIVKNSWWHDSGRGDGCFYLSYSSVIGNKIAFDYGKDDKYENIYFYDGSRVSSNKRNPSINDKKVAAIFKAKKGQTNKVEKVSGISFNIANNGAKNIKVKASLYKNVKEILNPNSIENNPENGDLVFEKIQEYSNPGFFTIKIPNPIEVYNGENFSIILEIINSDGDGRIQFTEEQNSYNDRTYYFDLSKNTWLNCSQSQNLVARIRATTYLESNNLSLTNDLKNSFVNLPEKYYSQIYRLGNDKPTPLVLFNNRELTKDVDYTLEYFEELSKPESSIPNALAGYGKIIIKGINQYFGTQEISYPIMINIFPPSIIYFKEQNWEFYDVYETTLKLKINKKDYPNITNYSQIPLPENWQWVIKENDDVTKINYIEYIGSDKDYVYKTMFDVKFE
ncbi:MAG: hypothetical protein IJ997_01580 [Mycoplasmataceae bacterium]|nr:hypothetical protein [Mycoplasmataceae bacterium]